MNLDKIRQQLQQATDNNVFSPTEAQRKAKSAFWSYFLTGDALPPPVIDLATASKLAGDRRISEWWKQEGFSDWFSNKDEFRQRVEFLADIALDELYTLIKSQSTAAPAKVAAIRMVMDVGHKISNKQTEKDTSEDKISRMSREELEVYIKSRVAKLLPDSEHSESQEELQ